MVKIIRKNTEKKKLDMLFSTMPAPKKLDAYQFAGKVKLTEDPVKIQRRLRDDWK